MRFCTKSTGLAWVWGVVWVWVGVVGAVSVGGGVLSLRGGEVGHRYDQATCSWSNTRINLRWTCTSHPFPAFVELVPSVVDVRACACVCVRVCARACVCVCVCYRSISTCTHRHAHSCAWIHFEKGVGGPCVHMLVAQQQCARQLAHLPVRPPPISLVG
jgi:hypothetical protein